MPASRQGGNQNCFSRKHIRFYFGLYWKNTRRVGSDNIENCYTRPLRQLRNKNMNIESPKFTLPQDKLEDIKSSRLDVLKPPQNLPSYLLLGREVREKLKETVGDKGFPETPQNLNNLDEFFTGIESTVNQYWDGSTEPEKSAQNVLKNECEKWAEQLEKLEKAEKIDDDEKEEFNEVVSLLGNYDEVKKRLQEQNFSKLDPLKKWLPDAWYSLLATSSEIQLAQVVLGRKWSKELPDETLEKFQIKRAEIVLPFEFAAYIGKLIDHGYFKQEELSNEPGGEGESKYAEEKGNKYLYTPYLSQESTEAKKIPFSDIFSFEYKRFAEDLTHLAEKTEKQINNQELPETYQGLPDYLRQLAETYCSKEIDSDRLYEQWLNLYRSNAELLKNGCPLVINPQEDAPTNVVGIEMRVGFRPTNLQNLEKKSNAYAQTAFNLSEKILKRIPGTLEEEPEQASDIFLNQQIFSFGTNLSSETLGENYHRQSFIPVNENEKTAIKNELPLLKKLFPNFSLDQKDYTNQAILETLRHELGHEILPSEDKKISRKIGQSAAANAIEELKAETVGMKLVMENMTDINAKELNDILLAKLGGALRYLKYKSSKAGTEDESYYLCGKEIIASLLANGTLKFDGSHLSITDARQGIVTISEIGDEILKLYQDKETKPKQIKGYISQIRNLKDDKSFNQLMETIKQIEL